MLRQWVESGLDPAKVTVVDPGKPQAPEGVRVVAEAPTDGAPEMVMLGVKPQMLDTIAPALAPHIAGARVLISIMAGVDEAALARRFDVGCVVRAMPNLPVSLGQGVVGLFSSKADAGARDRVTELMQPLGLVEWLDSEDLLHSVTALAGSGPGYVYRFIDALAEAGAEVGLPADQALRLAESMVAGAAALARQSDDTPGALADKVASPGGTTRAGLDVLDREAGIRPLLVDVLKAARKRSEELAEAAR